MVCMIEATNTFEFYAAEGFKLFPCNIDKTPRVSSWRSSQTHIDPDSAERIAATGNYIGAWLPRNYVVIDVDRGHKDGQDGLPTFQELCTSSGIEVPQTLTVKTGSGGLHLYFTLPEGVDYRTLSQKSLADAVDVRTHLGYVIAAGTNGYSVANNVVPMELPQPLLALIQTRNKDRAKDYVPTKELPVDVLERILSKVPAEDFSTNDDWQEFVTSCIAVSGNSAEALDAIETWSKSDPTYAKDTTVRKRLETFEPAGGITAGTFIHTLKTVGVSKYLIDKARLYIGAHFSIDSRFAEFAEAPFTVDYSIATSDAFDLAEAYYYKKMQVSAVELFTRLVEGSLLYVQSERAFFYFDGNRWVERAGILDILPSVLISAMIRFYTDHSKENDGDADEYITSVVNYTCTYATLSRFEHAVKQHPAINVSAVDWDAPKLAGTLTLEDSVLDFSQEREIKFRRGLREEYRKRFIDLKKKDFDTRSQPAKFKEFLRDVFPDSDTRKTATYVLSTMLSGSGKWRKFHLWNGSGRNGKSTLMELMKHVIGDRAITYKPETLLSQTHTQSLTPELEVFRGALVAFSSETEEAKRVSQGKVKTLAGNDTIVANPKYKGIIEFKPTYQLVLATNYLPTFSAHDSAFIDRLLVLPFYTCFYENEEQKATGERKGSRYFAPAKDVTKLTEEIQQERAQILFYLASRYQEIAGNTSLPESGECLAAKSHYVDDNSDIFQFFEEFVEYDTEPKNGKGFYFTPSKDLVNFYNSENNTKYSAKFVIMRLKEVYPHVETCSKSVDGKLTRGIKHIRIRYGAYREGWEGNYTPEEARAAEARNAEF